ncbi:MAG: hypothetical protein NC311_15400 [Muribaculaceae bacterium]|nr:hypothetical protein [Muribaculaceae bacterium]
MTRANDVYDGRCGASTTLQRIIGDAEDLLDSLKTYANKAENTANERVWGGIPNVLSSYADDFKFVVEDLENLSEATDVLRDAALA